jgi:hypothetical protein
MSGYIARLGRIVEKAVPSRKLLGVSTFENLVEQTVEATLAPGQPLTVEQIVRNVSIRVLGPAVVAQGRVVGVGRILVILQANPDRFIRVAPDTWARRGDGPEAGVPSRRPRPPLEGGAAATATPPQPPTDVDAVARPHLAAG